MVIRATPVARTMLRWELRSVSKASTWAYCAAFATAAGTNRALVPTRLALVLRLATLCPVAADVFAATAGTQMLRINHVPIYALTPQ